MRCNLVLELLPEIEGRPSTLRPPGDIIGDLNSRRGRIESMEDLMGGAKLVKAFVPLANMFGYTSDIRSMSQGRAASTMELADYEEVPPNVAAEIIEKRPK